ncbi:MAG TPA: urate hydroxylase PuuD [Gaiellaceae bacterium]|nr:urate hydroxylase PuuD [Gaiellaceae bacterium]
MLAVDPYLVDWLDLVFRWFHVTAAIVWIGTSFYFVALDNHLTEPREERDRERGVGGEAWEIHGGGLYRVEKFRVAPQQLPEPLHWFKWEAYWTWISGFTLFTVLYYLQPHTYLIDSSVANLTAWEAIAISIGGLVLAWLVYDALCRTVGQRSELALALLVLGVVVATAYGSSRLFAARAAYLQVGAMLGTIMVANVFFSIIPAHRELIRAKEAGREPDPALNALGKQRSVHNNYLTLPVLFAMLAGHFPFTYGHAHSWLILVCLMAIGAWIRHYFNNRHAGRTLWWIPLSVAAALAGLALWLRPASTPAAATPVAFARVFPIVEQRCAFCHSLHPRSTQFTSAPRGIVLDTPQEIASQARLIKTVAVDSTLMPFGNATRMTAAERRLLGEWIAAGAKTG